MKLSSKSRYAVRIMTNLADYYTTNPVPAATIADQEQLSLKYLEGILNQLQKAHLLHSFRGAQGGYRLAKPPEEINMLQIIQATENTSDITPCSHNPELCPNSSTCATSDLWALLQSTIDELLSNLTLLDMLKMKEKKTGTPSLYLMHLNKLKKIRKS